MRHRHPFRRLGALTCTAALVLALLPAAGAAAGGLTPAESTNAGGIYNGYHACPAEAYLYQDGENLIRMEYDPGQKIISASTGEITMLRPEQIIVETYNSRFQLLESRTLEKELPIWGGFFAGADYNFVIFGQANLNEDDSVEVVRVVKYDKNWNRLDHASLYGANTIVPFDWGGMGCAESNGHLYLRTAHSMYMDADGLNHQMDMMLNIRQLDMTITNSYTDVALNSGYVAHSFNQLLLVDQQQRLVALSHGDATLRGAVLTRYKAPAGGDSFLGTPRMRDIYPDDTCVRFAVDTWPGASGANNTGAQVTGLAETSTGYLSAYSETGLGDASDNTNVYNVYLAYTDKNNFSESGTTVRQLTNFSASSTQYGAQPRLVPTGLDGGYILWHLADKNGDYFYYSDNIQYARYGADGTISDIRAAENAPLSNCQPIYYNGQAVWFTTHESTPTFYTLDDSGVTAYPMSAAQPEPEPEPGTGSFADVPAGAWYAPYVNAAAQAGLMEGTGDGRFNPNGTLSIAEVVTLAARLHTSQFGLIVPTAPGPWYMGAYNYCVANGLFDEIRLPLSTMDNLATRFDMVDILNRAVPESETAPIHPHIIVPDLAESDPYGWAVYRWYRAGITQGDQDGNFNGSSHITRAETAAMLCRLAGLADRV